MSDDFDIFDTPNVRRNNSIETLRLKACLLGRDIEYLKQNKLFESYQDTITRATNDWFRRMNDFFDILESATCARK